MVALIHDPWRGPVPSAAPLTMPAQHLHRTPSARHDPPRLRTRLARLLAFGGALVVTGLAAEQVQRAFAGTSATWLQEVWAVLFVVTFAWIAFAATSTLAGVLLPPRRPRVHHEAPLESRTAIVMPIYEEDAVATAATLGVLGHGLADLGHGDRFELFLLSDTRSPEGWLRETTAFRALRRELGGRMAVWYRRRARNVGRKAGNIQDFVERWGGRFDFFLVLDADSLMAPATVVALVRRMQADPKLALLQTAPVLYGGGTLYARLQDAASSLYGPTVARGVAAWQGEDGNYWGHNALLRTRAFAAAAGLPTLPGAPPFGGAISSHDFVEAALLRRAGWRVRMDADLGGSFEGGPPSLAAAAVRDRRWAQGNLQHTRIVGAKGLAWISRAHLVLGILSYLASPLWLLVLGVGLLLTVQAQLVRPEYFPTAYQLFPAWPRFDAVRMGWLFAGSILLLLTPKLIGLCRTLAEPESRRRFGGTGRTLGCALGELVLSTLLAPMIMLTQSRQLVDILLGHDSGWSAQERRGAAMPWGEAIRRRAGAVLLGAGLALVLGQLQPELVAWFLPVLAGLLLAPVLERLSSDPAAAARLARWRLLPRVVDPMAQHLVERAEAVAARMAGATSGQLVDLVDHPDLRAAHVDALDAADRDRGEGATLAAITARAKVEAAAGPEHALCWLTREERLALLADPDLLERWAGRLHPAHGEALPLPQTTLQAAALPS
ncbi:MAG: glucans biosynthesis glucosyltransferase MdoH [Pseudomonadota bacterium]